MNLAYEVKQLVKPALAMEGLEKPMEFLRPVATLREKFQFKDEPSKRRIVFFLDDPETSLYRDGWILRIRCEKKKDKPDELEITLKYRMKTELGSIEQARHTLESNLKDLVDFQETGLEADWGANLNLSWSWEKEKLALDDFFHKNEPDAHNIVKFLEEQKVVQGKWLEQYQKTLKELRLHGPIYSYAWKGVKIPKKPVHTFEAWRLGKNLELCQTITELSFDWADQSEDDVQSARQGWQQDLEAWREPMNVSKTQLALQSY